MYRAPGLMRWRLQKKTQLAVRVAVPPGPKLRLAANLSRSPWVVFVMCPLCHFPKMQSVDWRLHTVDSLMSDATMKKQLCIVNLSRELWHGIYVTFTRPCMTQHLELWHTIRGHHGRSGSDAPQPRTLQASGHHFYRAEFQTHFRPAMRRRRAYPS